MPMNAEYAVERRKPASDNLPVARRNGHGLMAMGDTFADFR